MEYRTFWMAGLGVAVAAAGALWCNQDAEREPPHRDSQVPASQVILPIGTERSVDREVDELRREVALLRAATMMNVGQSAQNAARNGKVADSESASAPLDATEMRKRFDDKMEEEVVGSRNEERTTRNRSQLEAEIERQGLPLEVKDLSCGNLYCRTSIKWFGDDQSRVEELFSAAPLNVPKTLNFDAEGRQASIYFAQEGVRLPAL